MSHDQVQDTGERQMTKPEVQSLESESQFRAVLTGRLDFSCHLTGLGLLYRGLTLIESGSALEIAVAAVANECSARRNSGDESDTEPGSAGGHQQANI